MRERVAITGTVTGDRPLIPRARFGTALHRARTSRNETVTAVSRRSDRRFLPDDLIAFERGEQALADDAVVELTALYRLPARPMPIGSDVEFVLDRSTCALPSQGRDRDDDPGWIVARVVALSVLVGLDATTGPHGVDNLAEALDVPARHAADVVERLIGGDESRVAEMIDAIERRVVVPAVGVLVAETTVGELMMVGRRRGTTSPATLAAAAPLGDLVRAAQT